RVGVLGVAIGGVEGGDLSRRIPVQTADEMGRLSQGFNSMLGRLSQADAQIRAFNQRLAAEIEAATHDLSEKNATLEQLNRLLNDMRLDNASKVRLATLGPLGGQPAQPGRARAAGRCAPRCTRRSARPCGRCLGACSGRCASASCRRRCASAWTYRRER